MKRFKEFLIEGSSLDTTTFSKVHKDIYGDKSTELIADAQKRQQEQQGKSGDISNIVSLPNYNLKDKKSDILLLDKLPIISKDGRQILGQAENVGDGHRVTIYTKGLSKSKVLGTTAHEFSHTIAPSWREKPNSLAKNEEKGSFGEYSLSSSELPAFQSGYEAEYYTDTGKTLSSIMSDQEYDEFVGWGEKTGKISKEHLAKMKDPKTKETMKELARQVAVNGKKRQEEIAQA